MTAWVSGYLFIGVGKNFIFFFAGKFWSIIFDVPKVGTAVLWI